MPIGTGPEADFASPPFEPELELELHAATARAMTARAAVAARLPSTIGPPCPHFCGLQDYRDARKIDPMYGPCQWRIGGLLRLLMSTRPATLVNFRMKNHNLF